MKWILTLAVVVMVVGFSAPHATRRFRIGQLPGDLSLRWRGTTYRFPFGSTLLLTGLLWLVGRLV